MNQKLMFFWNSLPFSMIHYMLAISSLVPLTFLNPACISVHILLKPGLKAFEHYLANMWNEPNCTVIWTFFGIALLTCLIFANSVIYTDLAQWSSDWPGITILEGCVKAQLSGTTLAFSRQRCQGEGWGGSPQELDISPNSQPLLLLLVQECTLRTTDLGRCFTSALAKLKEAARLHPAFRV